MLLYHTLSINQTRISEIRFGISLLSMVCQRKVGLFTGANVVSHILCTLRETKYISGLSYSFDNFWIYTEYLHFSLLLIDR